LTGKKLYISFMTFAELWESACHRGWGYKKRDELKKQLARDFVLLPFDELTQNIFFEHLVVKKHSTE
jgi:hypothetical protein